MLPLWSLDFFRLVLILEIGLALRERPVWSLCLLSFWEIYGLVMICMSWSWFSIWLPLISLDWSRVLEVCHDFLSLLWILQFILNFYTLVLIFKDCSGFQHVYLFVFVSLSRFQSIGYDIYGVALDFWILTSSFFGIGCDFRRFAFWSLDFFGLVLIFYIGLYFFSLIFLFMHVFWFLGSG